MSTVNPWPLPTYTWPQVTNITPFTYRDGWTYLEVLENLRSYITNELVPAIDAENTEFEESVQDNIDMLTIYVDTAIAGIIDNSVIVQDSVVKTLLQNLTSQTRIALNAILANLVIEDGSDPGTFVINDWN